MFHNTFNNLSISDKNKHSTIDINNGLKIDKEQSIDINAPTVKSEVLFSNTCHRSFNLPEIRFTNKIPKLSNDSSIPSNIILGLNLIKNDKDVLKRHISKIDHSLSNANRIEKIFCKYLDKDKYEEYMGCFYKSDLRTDLSNRKRGSFRVISLYVVEPLTHKKQKHSKHKLVVILFDPYHLCLPSRDYGDIAYDRYCKYDEDFEKILLNKNLILRKEE